MSLRRSHKKSRLGCQECKRRHVKCDEGRPTCANCRDTCRTCVYQPPQSHTVRPPPAPFLLQPPSTSNSASTTPATSVASPTATSSRLTAITPVQHGAVYPPLNMHHMELFSHFIFETAPSLEDGGPSDREYLRIMMPAALSAPYLMHQILGLAALHISHTRVSEAKHYRDEATALQTQALCLFNETLTEITSENCVPILIFASAVGLHSLAEAVIASETAAEDFLDRFVTYLNLHRGVRIVTEQSWKFLTQSNLSSILKRAERSLDATSSQSHERATLVANHLENLLDHTDMDTASATACRNAVSHLQLIHQSELLAEEVPKEEQQSTSLIWAWPILLSGVFTDLLMKRNPEALIILSHYAVLLHQHRRLWLVGNAGRMLIEAITRFLGTYWKQWLIWPNQVLNEPS
ncbi:hypothetical protein K458DRAFT_492928 [Lentithecium fluviatile CBS 122367]|uniref:Zn(2)-C6 fungal-type domain-containing protein n=1 Tax=Lentithecium fluviatile CBS 122367 TaxID=1168545 RepID=A0A6G1IBY2_9PLEO|nr:hypothetical protein K458DRAFT_492928 [Lentithecium fluviatile CBS 122367]